MKTIYILLAIISSSIFAGETESYSFSLSDGSRLSLKRTDGSYRELWLKSKESAELIYKGQFSPQKSLFARGLKVDSHNATEIIQATKKDDTLLVLFKINSRKLKISRAGSMFTAALPAPYSEYATFDISTLLDGYSYFLRSYVKENGVWKVKISVFLRTLWSDTYDQEVSKLSIENSISYKVHYKGTWKVVEYIMGGRTKRFEKGMYKITDTKGETVKNIVFDEKNELLLTVEKGEKCYIQEAVWWHELDEHNDFSVLRKNNARAAKAKFPIYYSIYICPGHDIKEEKKLIKKQSEASYLIRHPTKAGSYLYKSKIKH